MSSSEYGRILIQLYNILLTNTKKCIFETSYLLTYNCHDKRRDVPSTDGHGSELCEDYKNDLAYPVLTR